jgi:Tfp pilus assembly protein PilO
MSIFEGMSFRLKAVVAVSAIVLGIILLYFALFRPKIAHTIQTRAKLESMLAEMDKQLHLEAIFAAPDASQQHHWPEVDAELSERIPETIELPVALEEIAALAKSRGIKDLTMTTLPKGGEGAASEPKVVQIGNKKIPVASEDESSVEANPMGNLDIEETIIKMSFHSEYETLGEFLEGLSALPRFVLIDGVEVGRELPKPSVTLSVRVFSLHESDSSVQANST